MNGLIKVIISVAVIMAAVAGSALWLYMDNGQSQTGQIGQENGSAPAMAAEIPAPLELVALEEYAIEFEGAPRVAADVELCNIVKAQCQAQHIRVCEDYEMCLSGIAGQ